MAAHGRIRVGIGGWSFAPWRETFYPADVPKARELDYASREMTTIEINGTFYRTQAPSTFAKWRKATPEGFVFALKAPRYATNRKVLAEAGDSIGRFVTSGLVELGDRLGPINWQLAPTKRYEADDFAAFLDLLPRAVDGIPLRHAVEARHASFAKPEVVEAARARGVAMVFDGDSKYAPIADPTADFVYVRIMGTAEDVPTGYPPAALDHWAARAETWAAGGTPDDLPLLTAALGAEPREVFLYVIAGAKARNPAAATALLTRLAGDRARDPAQRG
jgi:uncharacterized protein YecE (DUF72 family)